MRDPEAIQRLERAAKIIATAVAHTPAALATARADATGIKAQSFDGVIVSGHGVSDPTGQAAIAPGMVDRQVEVIHRAAVVLEEFGEEYLWAVQFLKRSPLTHAEARRREDERKDLAGQNEERCRSCERTEVAPGLRRAEPVHRRTDGGGVYSEITPLCWWCYRFVFDTERIPTVEEVEKHHRGEKVRRKAS